MSSSRRANGLALLGSFFVYLVPVFGPHAFWLVGEMLFHHAKDPLWAEANWGLALLVQGVAFIWFRFCFRCRFGLSSVSSRISRSGWDIAGLAFIPVAWFALLYGYMQVIPAWRLIEADLAPEKAGLAELCRVDGKWITLSGQFDRVLLAAARSELLVQDSTGQKYFLLHLPACTLTEVPLPANTPQRAIAPVGLARGGRILYTEAVHGQPSQNYGVLLESTLVPLAPFQALDPTKTSQPQLSPDGKAVAWIVRVPGKSGELKTAAFGESGLGAGTSFDLSQLGAGSYDLVDVSEGAREILVARNLREYLYVTASGKTLWVFTAEPGVRPMLGSLRIPAGTQPAKLRDYLAWEGYREEGRYVVQWRRGDKLVQKEIPLGRSITSADASPDGRFIAASTAPAVSLGGVDDAVIIWSVDGNEVFRKRLSPYNRAPVAFLAGNLVAYSEVDRQGVGVTRVLKLW